MCVCVCVRVCLHVCVLRCVYVCMHVYSMSTVCLLVHKTLLSVTQRTVQGSTLDATMKLLCAVVRGIIQREDQFVLKLQVCSDEQVSRLVELEDIAKYKCAVTRLHNVLELKPLCESP